MPSGILGARAFPDGCIGDLTLTAGRWTKLAVRWTEAEGVVTPKNRSSAACRPAARGPRPAAPPIRAMKVRRFIRSPRRRERAGVVGHLDQAILPLHVMTKLHVWHGCGRLEP